MSQDLVEHVDFSKALMEGVMSLVDCHQQSLTLPDNTKSVESLIALFTQQARH